MVIRKNKRKSYPEVKLDFFEFEESLNLGLNDKELAVKHNLSEKDLEKIQHQIKND
ncbi:hypothetical protein PRVXH_001966 [Proteinivorax hydrogeniformans]|uniref:Uncharacterized protein n=1 Tax=Proteinivorax hydrogeniformans TaxID=1826727 RepID=A0AAU8HR58_9FIRM